VCMLLLNLVVLLLVCCCKRQHLGDAAARRLLLLGDEVPDAAVEGAAGQRHGAPDGVHARDGVPEDGPRRQHRHGHLQVARHVEGHRRRRVDHVEDGEVEAEGEHARGDDDGQRRHDDSWLYSQLATPDPSSTAAGSDRISVANGAM
jgi:hypothetical protein